MPYLDGHNIHARNARKHIYQILAASWDWVTSLPISLFIQGIGSKEASEITKINMELTKTTSDSVVFSGLLPNLTSEDMFRCMSTLHRWLSRWCPENNVTFIDHWGNFLGKSWRY